MSDAPKSPRGGEADVAFDVAGEDVAATRDRRLEYFTDGHRPGEDVALSRVAAESHQRFALRLHLDALCHRIETERIGERKNGARQRHRIHAFEPIVFVHQPLDEGAMDLEDVDGKAMQVGERHPTLEYLTMDAPNAADHIVTGVFPDHWTGSDAVVVLRNPAVAMPLQATVYISDKAPARRVTILLDGREVAAQTYDKAGLHTLASAPVRGNGATATVEVEVDKTFSDPPDTRRLGVVLSGVGFKQ